MLGPVKLICLPAALRVNSHALNSLSIVAAVVAVVAAVVIAVIVAVVVAESDVVVAEKTTVKKAAKQTTAISQTKSKQKYR